MIILQNQTFIDKWDNIILSPWDLEADAFKHPRSNIKALLLTSDH